MHGAVPTSEHMLPASSISVTQHLLGPSPVLLASASPQPVPPHWLHEPAQPERFRGGIARMVSAALQGTD